MAILQKLKSLLGLSDAESQRQESREVSVTVERERTDQTTAASSGADAVTDAGVSDETSLPSDPDVSQEPTPDELIVDAEADTDETESSPDTDESPVEESDVSSSERPAEAETSERAIEGIDEASPAEEPDASPAEQPAEVEASETALEGTDEESPAEESDEQPVPSPPERPAEAETSETATEGTDDADPVTAINGIGPAYADRLADVDIHSTTDLADADPETLGEQTDLSPKRIQRWIDQVEQH